MARAMHRAIRRGLRSNPMVNLLRQADTPTSIVALATYVVAHPRNRPTWTGSFEVLGPAPPSAPGMRDGRGSLRIGSGSSRHTSGVHRLHLSSGQGLVERGRLVHAAIEELAHRPDPVVEVDAEHALDLREIGIAHSQVARGHPSGLYDVAVAVSGRRRTLQLAVDVEADGAIAVHADRLVPLAVVPDRALVPEAGHGRPEGTARPRLTHREHQTTV